MRKAFLCYAAHDRAEVLRRAQVLSLVGLESVMDVTSLSAGETWDREIVRAIDEADIFVLFWPAAAKASDSVEREWRHALATNHPNPSCRLPLKHPCHEAQSRRPGSACVRHWSQRRYPEDARKTEIGADRIGRW